jgi:hypothetical protein
MKISIRKLFVLLAIVMSFVFVQASWALDCSHIVSGEITNDPSFNRGIEITNENNVSTTIYGIPDYLNLEQGDNITIHYSVQPGGDLVACSLVVDGDTIVLRPRIPVQLIGQSVTVAADTDCTCDNCYCNCPDDCQDCTCDCLCNCICDGTGPHGPKGPKK